MTSPFLVAFRADASVGQFSENSVQGCANKMATSQLKGGESHS